MESSTVTVTAFDDPVSSVAARSQWQIFWSRFRRHKLGLIGLVGLSIILFMAIFGPMISPYEWNSVDDTFLTELLTKGDSVAAPSWSHPFGRGDLGQDELTRVMVAGRISLMIGLFTAIVASLVGTVLGIMAGYFGRGWDVGISRLTDLFLAAPVLVMLIAISVAVEKVDLFIIVTILALFSWMALARIVRAEVLTLKEREYVQAARAMGASHRRIMFRHLLPNSIGAIVVFLTLSVAISILTETALSFLGLGLNQATQPSWGVLLSVESEHVFAGTYWWLTVFPGLFIVLTILFISFLGDALRDALDPHAFTGGKVKAVPSTIAETELASAPTATAGETSAEGAI